MAFLATVEKILTYTRLENMTLGQFKMVEHQAKYKALREGQGQ